MIKIVHQHYGYTSLTNDLLSKSPELRIKVRRNDGCDETYGSFTNEADKLAKEMIKDATNGIEPIKFIKKTKDIMMPNDFLLKCFTMQQNDFEVIKDR